MSWVSKQLKSVGKVGKKVGKAIGKGWEAIDDVALPLIGNALLPGVGGVLGGMAAGAIGNGRPTIKRIGAGALTGAVTGYGGSLLGGGGKAAGAAGGAANSVAPGVANAASAGANRGIGSSLLGGLKKIGGFALDNIDPIMGAASMYQGAKAQGKADDLNKRALALREQQYADFAPIRKLGIAGMQNTQRPDLSAIYRNQQNPFA